MRKSISTLSLIGLLFVSFQACSSANRTEICIKNNSKNIYYVTGTGLDNYDWEDLYDNGAMNRPDHNWIHKQLKPSETKCELADVNVGPETVGFWFVVSNSLSLPPSQTRLQLTYGSRRVGRRIIADVGHWIDVPDLSSPINTLGRLHSPHKCADPRDPVAKTCTLFVITD